MDLHRIAVVIATDRSLAETIRNAMMEDIRNILPTYELYDVHPEKGKGYRTGYVSFGIKPSSWHQAGINGGILVQGEYAIVKSKAPDQPDPKFKNPDFSPPVDELISLKGGYYLKKLGGKIKELDELGYYNDNLGEWWFSINEKEQLDNHGFFDTDTFKNGISKIEEDVLKNPPEGAQSAESQERQRRYNILTYKNLVKKIHQENRNWFTLEEAKEVAAVEDATLNTIIDRLKRNYLNLKR